MDIHKEDTLLDIFQGLSPHAQDLLIEYAEKLIDDEQVLIRGQLLLC